MITNCMVIVAQLVEPRIVIPVVVGSSPISHPSLFLTVQVQCAGRYYAFYDRLKSCCAKVAELVDALVLGTSVLRRESSSLSFRTI